MPRRLPKLAPRGRPAPFGNTLAVGNCGRTPDVLLEEQVQLVFERMVSGAGPLALWQWCAAQGWTATRSNTVLRRVRERLHKATAERAEDTRSRLLMSIEQLIPKCMELVTGTEKDVGTVILKDTTSPEYLELQHLNARKYRVEQGLTKRSLSPNEEWTDADERRVEELSLSIPPLRCYNHAAIVKYYELIMRMTGIDKVVVEHRGGERPYRDMSTAELRAELARLEEEEAAGATEVEATTTDDEGEADGR